MFKKYFNLMYFQFLTELTKLFQKARQSGSVSVTFKRCEYTNIFYIMSKNSVFY